MINMKRELLLYLTLAVFAVVSFVVFNKVYATSRLVIDEEFHLRQGLHFCKGRFDIVSRLYAEILNKFLIQFIFLQN